MEKPTLRYTPEQLESHLKWKLEHKEFVIKYLDTKVKPPAQIGAELWEQLKKLDITNWEVVCGAVEILSFMSAQFPQITPYIRDLAKEVYSAHYLYLHDNVVSIDELQAEYTKSGQV